MDSASVYIATVSIVSPLKRNYIHCMILKNILLDMAVGILRQVLTSNKIYTLTILHLGTDWRQIACPGNTWKTIISITICILNK
jgi:hypothetical protein